MRIATLTLLSSMSACSIGCGLVLDLEPRHEGGLDAAVGDAAARDARAEDAPADEPDGCAPRPESCDGRDDDCDGVVDEGFELASDPGNCGSCGSVCSANGGTPRCVGGVCEITCVAGRRDCDGDAANGCESDLASPASCGSCDVSCTATQPFCAASSGGAYACVGDCEPGLTLCGGTCTDLDTDTANCGDCGSACFEDMHGIIGCVAGACAVLDCGDWRGDCNGDASDGCETELLVDPAHCAMCGSRCATGQACEAGACVAPP